MTDARVRYSILGTVQVVRGDTELEVGPPKRLALLSLLLLHAPGPLTLNEAVDMLWDADPPPSALNVVHRHIGALRRTLEPELESRTKAEHLVRAPDGYRLFVDAATSDLLRFRDLRARARRAVTSGEPVKGAQDFVEALRLWRGPTVAAGTQVAEHPLFTAVGHEYVAAVKEGADVVLAAAPALTEDVLMALRRAVERHPYDEAIHSRIIAALAATGRQAEALRQFEDIRGSLAEELGVEPGPGLLAAQQGLLRLRRSAAPEVRRPATPAVPSVRPAQLPADCALFAGRREAVQECLDLLPPEGESQPPPLTAAICGMAGVGKSTLAVHWAHLVADRYPDGQIYVDLQGHHTSLPPLGPTEAMRQVLDALGVGRGRADAGEAALGSLFRSALAGRRLLIVLDDARDSAQVRPLLPGAPGCLAIVTARRRLEGLAVTDHAHLVTLHPPSRRESLDLLARRVGTERVKAERSAAGEIVDLCGRLPLTLALSGTRATAHPEFPLAALAVRLREHHGSLAAFAGHDARTDARRVFARSYEALTSGGARLFRLIGLHPPGGISASALAALAGTDPRTSREHVAELADHHLLVEKVPGRYTCHTLLRAYARELCDAVDSVAVRSEVRVRVLDHYLYSADAATASLAPHRGRAPLPPAGPGVLPRRFAGPAEAAEWIAAERHVLRALVGDVSRCPRAEAARTRLAAALHRHADGAETGSLS